MKKDITALFCLVDDFYKSLRQEIGKHQISNEGKIRKPTRIPGLIESEIMTIILMYQESPCRNFKYFYNSYLQLYKSEFLRMPSYERFITLMPRVLYLLTILFCCILRKCSKVAYIDSTSLNVCHGKRIKSNKVFKGLAKIGKSTKGWFFGFKLHIIIDEKGNLMNAKLTKGNADDRYVVPQMTADMTGFLFADKGYISRELFLRLLARGLKLITGIKNNMKNVLMPLHEKLLLRKRSLVETVFDYLKNKFMLEHSRHRSFINMLVHIISTLIAYQLKPSKPSASMKYYIHANP
jgi:hypothetical protein